MKSLFAVRDCKSEQFYPPYVANNVADGLRNFDQLCKNSETMIAKYPADYALFHIGGFDEQTAAVTAIQPVQVGLAIEYVAQSPAKLGVANG